MSEATRIKFCGIARPEDAQHAAALGAWAIGMILWPGSKRYCRPEVAAEIGATMQRKVEIAGVFVNAHLDRVVESADAYNLTLLQLHGDEGPSYCAEAARRTGARVIKVARVKDRQDVQALRPFRTDFHLLDAYDPRHPGGTGETFAWELVREHRRDRPLILSGGLTPGNVGEAIEVVRPFAVDVASGIELSPGIKDHKLMEAFAAAVAEADGGAAPAGLQPRLPSQELIREARAAGKEKTA